MRSTLLKGALATVAATAALAMAFTGTASADPAFGTPDTDDLVGVGSDTTQFLIDTAADRYDPAPGTVRLASFDALNPATGLPGDQIQIRPGVSIARPNGSSAGISALNSNTNLDFARSSRESAVGAAEDQFEFIPAAVDGLSYAYDNTGSSVPNNLTRAQLIEIYTCTSSLALEPKLPQTGSGTRNFFLEQLGSPGAPLAPGSCVTNVQEHDPAAVNGDSNALVPFSVARWRVNPPNPTNPPQNTISIAATGVSGSTFYASRTVFNVVRNGDATTPKFQEVFGPTGYLCSLFDADPDSLQGFTDAPNCGTAVADR